MAISVLYESSRGPKCSVCTGHRGGTYSTERAWMEQVFHLCPDCAADDAVVRRIEELMAHYSEVTDLPSWWARLWMPRIEAHVVLLEINTRRWRERDTRARVARNQFTA